jgi:hypothetical protein
MNIGSIRGFLMTRQKAVRSVVDLDDPLLEARKTRHV